MKTKYFASFDRALLRFACVSITQNSSCRARRQNRIYYNANEAKEEKEKPAMPREFFQGEENNIQCLVWKYFINSTSNFSLSRLFLQSKEREKT